LIIVLNTTGLPHLSTDMNHTNQTETRITAHIRRTFRSLQHRNYRLWFFGQMISLFGTWMQSAAQGFFIFKLTNSVFYLGLVGFMTGLPFWLFTLYGGVISDRFPRRSVLLVTQTSMMTLALILALLTFSGVIKPWHILILSFLLGVANAFDTPARHAFVADLVPKEDLGNAVALNSTMFNISVIVGPVLAGLIYAILGPAWCFLLNGTSFLAVIAALSLMRVEYSISRRRGSAVEEVLSGLSYLKKRRDLLGIIATAGAISLFGLAFTYIVPAWAVKILNGDAATNGLLQAARGLGALITALALASTISLVGKRGRLLEAGALLLPISIVAFSFSRSLHSSLMTIMLTGVFHVLAINIALGLLQDLSADEFRGRVSSVYSLIYFGLMPLGSICIGWLASRAGEPNAVLISGALLLISTLAILKLFPELSSVE